MEHPLISHPALPDSLFKNVDRLIKFHRSKLDLYTEQLIWWNKRVNLVSRDVSRETIQEHIRHSLLLTQVEEFQKHEFIIDAGSGGGLPGIPLAIVNTGKQFLLNDIVSKKMLAVKQMIKKLPLDNVDTSQTSIADVTNSVQCLVVSKHAFKIDDLLSMTSQVAWTDMIFYKGLDFNQEIKDINDLFSISVYDLSAGTDLSFYMDKAIVVVSK